MKKAFTLILTVAMVMSVFVFTPGAAVLHSDRSTCVSNIDFIVGRTSGGSDTTLVVAQGNSAPTTSSLARNQFAYIVFVGWFADSVTDISTYGYSINGGTITYDSSFAYVASGEDLPAATGKTYAMRYRISTPISSLGAGVHVLKAYARLTDNTEVELTTHTVTIAASAELVPTLNNEFVDNGYSFDFQSITPGLTVVASSAAGNLLRAHWTPRDGLAQTGGSYVQDGTNIYMNMNGFVSIPIDHIWSGAYEFSADIADAGLQGHGIFFNYSQERIDSIPLFEYSGTDDATGSQLLGPSGIMVYPKGEKTIEVAVITYDLSKTGDFQRQTGAIFYEFAVADSLSSFSTIKARDNGVDEITFYQNDVKFASVKYSNDGLYDENYAQRYYKTAQICDASGAAVATTDVALVSYYKTVGLGTRSCTMKVDNIVLQRFTPAISLDMPNNITGEVGTTVTVPVTLAGDANFCYVHGVITYPTALTYAGYTAGDLFAYDSDVLAVDNNASTGQIEIILMSNPLQNVKANGTLINLRFTIPASAANGTTYAISYAGAGIGDDFIDYSENEVPFTADGGLITARVTTYAVTYSYTGTVPDGAPSLPAAANYAAGTTVQVAAAPTLEGYTFSGWTATGATVANGAFTMPAGAVTLTGSWTAVPVGPTDITIKDASAAYFATVIRTGIARSTVLVARCTNPARGVVRAQLLSYLNDADYIRVYDKNGVLVSSAGARVETGWTVQLVDAAGNAVEGKSYKVAILGDVDADGRVTATDYSSATEASLDSNELTNEVYAAANIDNDRRLTPYDASAISLFVATSTW